jgi:hypothetical protein
MHKSSRKCVHFGDVVCSFDDRAAFGRRRQHSTFWRSSSGQTIPKRRKVNDAKRIPATTSYHYTITYFVNFLLQIFTTGHHALTSPVGIQIDTCAMSSFVDTGTTFEGVNRTGKTKKQTTIRDNRQRDDTTLTTGAIMTLLLPNMY